MNEYEKKERERPKPTLVTSAVIAHDGKYLLVRDDKFNFWRPPGGRVEWGETLEDTLRREMKEELGTEIQIIRTIGFGEDFAYHQTLDHKTHRVIFYFLCRAKNPILGYGDEGAGNARMKWVSRDEFLKETDMEPAFKDMMRRFDIRNILRMHENTERAEKFMTKHPLSSRVKESYFYHVRGVRKFAVLLCKFYNADIEIIEIASILHDIGADAGSKEHAEKSAEMAVPVLEKMDISEDKKERILSCIRHHSLYTPAENLEEQIIQDADSLSFFDGFWKLYLEERMIKKKRNKKEAISDTKEKLRVMEDKVRTDEGRRILAELINKTQNDLEEYAKGKL
ncbi:MAG: NUDIX domain-containing protein [Candidatus Micrarchaeota archaeon]|nr:NUDIX domain-containing protein [Candidatus Micrarchaeota archaeon]